MLQIVTGIYFREGVPRHETVQRGVFYTNRHFLRSDPIALPVGELAPSAEPGPVSTVAVSVTEYLEAEELDGRPSIQVATSGEQLLDDLADVLSFGLNATFSRDHDLVRRLVRAADASGRRAGAAGLFRGTFDPAVFVPDAELDELRAFMGQLLALERPCFEAVLKAIRRVVRGMRRAVDDPTVGYTDLVAALESLSDAGPGPVATWQQLDRSKRELIDGALGDAEPAVATAVRQAVLEAERTGAGSRFRSFVTNHLTPDFFRDEAREAVRPLRRPDLDGVLRRAYAARSQSVHSLWDLPVETWVLGDRADTVELPGGSLMLSLEGLARLARHVIREYVARAPAGVVEFDWRDSLPGRVQMTVAPQYWVHHAPGFSHDSAPRYFRGLVEHLLDVFAGHADGVTDMRGVLDEIERLVPGTADGDAKTTMVAMYALWHFTVVSEERRPNAERFLARYQSLLERPSLPAFVAGVLTGRLPEWVDEQWAELAAARRSVRGHARRQQLPAVLDALLQALAAEAALEAGRRDEAVTLAAHAVEELPGNDLLVRWESELPADGRSDLDLGRLIWPDAKDAGDGED